MKACQLLLDFLFHYIFHLLPLSERCLFTVQVSTKVHLCQLGFDVPNPHSRIQNQLKFNAAQRKLLCFLRINIMTGTRKRVLNLTSLLSITQLGIYTMGFQIDNFVPSISLNFSSLKFQVQQKYVILAKYYLFLPIETSYKKLRPFEKETRV